MKFLILSIVFSSVALAFPSVQQGEAELYYKRLHTKPIDEFPIDYDLLPRIINGTEAVPHSIPYQVYMIVTSQVLSKRWICGGTLISVEYVLTAAHCVNKASQIAVLFGAHNLTRAESTRVLVHSKNFTAHELFNSTTYAYDIAVIQLEEPVELNEYISLVTLPSREVTSTYEGVNVTVSGWGRTFWEGKRSDVLQEVNSTVMSNADCSKYFHHVKPSEICMSGKGGVSSCKGDSGGPLMYNDVQIGVVSHGVHGCPYGYPSVFARVTSYLEWLEEKTGLKF